MQATLARKPRSGRGKLSPDSLVVQTFEVLAQEEEEDTPKSWDLTCAVNTVWVCGTRDRVCPGC